MKKTSFSSKNQIFEMSKSKSSKKVVVTAQKKKVKISSSTSSRRSSSSSASSAPVELTFNKVNYMWMGIGAGLIALGLLLMTGGAMPSPDVWDTDIIYSTRRTIIAPIVILIGLCVEIYAIFKKE